MIKRGVFIEIPDGLPYASSISVGLCTTCEYLHIVLHDEDGRPFAQAVLSSEMVEEIATASVTKQ